MRKIFFILFLSSFSTLQAQEIQTVVISHKSIPVEVGEYEKIELGIKLPKTITNEINQFLQTGKEGINPFNPDEISIEAEFTPKTGVDFAPQTSKRIFGFYYQPYTRNVIKNTWETDTTAFPWRIRFAPFSQGSWQYTIKVNCAKTGQSFTSAEGYFKCIPSDNKGYLTRQHTGTRSDRYLKFEKNNETFFALGHNLVWTYGGKEYFNVEPVDFTEMSAWMNELADHGGNYTQIGLVTEQYGIEWVDWKNKNNQTLNNYTHRMPQAWEFDQVLELAREKGIYINALLDMHGVFQTEELMKKEGGDHHPNTTWNRNPYNSINQTAIPGIITPIDFLKSAEARKVYKRRLRYIVSRWGYSTNLSILELINEIDGMLVEFKYNESKEVRLAFLDWFTEMYNYIKQDLGAQQMVSGSYASDQVENFNEKIWPVADVILLHKYGNRLSQDWEDRWEIANEALNKSKNSPVIYDESGDMFPSLERYSLYYGHNQNWATSFMGTYGCRQSWNWGNAIHPAGKYKYYQPMKEFFAGEDLSSEKYQQFRWTNAWFNWSGNNVPEFQSFYLKNEKNTKVLGWFHNTSYWWGNEHSTNPEIKVMIDEGAQKFEAANQQNYKKVYREFKAEGKPDNKVTGRMKITDLKSGAKYSIRFYSTDPDRKIDKSIEARTNMFGTLKFDVPELTIFGDVAYKISLISE